MIRIGYSLIKEMGMHHNLLVHLCPEKNLSIMVKTPELSQHINMVVWCMDVVSLMSTPSVVKITMLFVVRASRVASSVARPRIS